MIDKMNAILYSSKCRTVDFKMSRKVELNLKRKNYKNLQLLMFNISNPKDRHRNKLNYGQQLKRVKKFVI